MLERETAAHQIASMAQRAILYEVSATPKPGLVDRNDPGAHKDMDFYTFMDSSVSLYKGFFDCAMAGLSFEGTDLAELFDSLRRPGMSCEAQMLRATGGVNTHKGIIFSLGIACAATGFLKAELQKKGQGSRGSRSSLSSRDSRGSRGSKVTMEQICSTVSQMTGHLIETDFKDLTEKSASQLSYGEKLYLHYGFTGIRGEVASGFDTIRREALPKLRKWHKDQDLTLNELLLDLLLRLMQSAEDTNLVTRGGIDGLVYAKRQAKDFIKSGGMAQENAHDKLLEMNLQFCDRRLSPGGAADLLSVAAFLAMNEGIL